MRDVVRAVTGGECIFFQGAAGNVLPKFAFTDTEDGGAPDGHAARRSRRSRRSRTAYSREVTRRGRARRAR